jgi:hypothetical protein
MKKTILTSIILTLIGGSSWVIIKYYQNKQEPTLIKAGEYPLTVQFISDVPGSVLITKKNDTLFLKGKTISNDSSGFLYLDGYVKNIVLDSFEYVGNINMFATKDYCDTIHKTGIWTFRRIDNRKFFRLKERETLCDERVTHFYIDIHIPKNREQNNLN